MSPNDDDKKTQGDGSEETASQPGIQPPANTAGGASGTEGAGVAGISLSVSANNPDEHFTESVSFVDELGIQDLRRPLVSGRGRKFSAAGRQTPVAEFTDEYLVLHPPQKPFQEGDAGPAEEIVLQMDETGVLVNEWGERKQIPGAKFNGRPIFQFWEQRPGTLKHYAVWFDDENRHHFLNCEGERLTVDLVYKLRNMTHNGELNRFKELIGE